MTINQIRNTIISKAGNESWLSIARDLKDELMFANVTGDFSEVISLMSQGLREYGLKEEDFKELEQSTKSEDSLTLDAFETVGIMVYFRHGKGLAATRNSINEAKQKQLKTIEEIYEYVKQDLSIKEKKESKR